MNKEAKNGTAGQYALTVIARIHSDFKTKFGIPRQSGLIDALTAEVVFEPEFRNADALRGIEGFPICGSSGSFLPPLGGPGRPRCGRPGWAEIRAWACLPHAHRFGPMLWDFPVCGCWTFAGNRSGGVCCMWRELI